MIIHRTTHKSRHQLKKQSQLVVLVDVFVVDTGSIVLKVATDVQS